MKLALGILAFALLAGTGKADSTWTYTGNSINYPYGLNPSGPVGVNPCGCALDGSVTLDAAGNPVAWNFTAAGVTWNTGNSSFTAFYDNLASESPLFTL